MQNTIQVFENQEFGKIRVIEKDGQPWWVLKDVCSALGLNSPHKVAERLDEDERNLIPVIDNVGRKQNTAIISESGLYAVVLRSDKPNAKTFRKWITSEVLPSIRKHGAYIKDDLLNAMAENSELTQEIIMQMLAERGKNESLKAKNEALLDYVCELAPKARYYDIILQCPDAVQTSIIAKDFGMTCVSFNKLLHGLGVQFKIGNTWLLYKEYANMGYTISRTYHINDKKTSIHTYWTQCGRRFLYDLLKYHGIVPDAEIYAVH